METDKELVKLEDLSVKLNHIRWGQGLLFLERWFAVIVVILLILTNFSGAAVVAFGVTVFLLFLHASTRQAALEDSVGLPGQRITVKI